MATLEKAPISVKEVTPGLDLEEEQQLELLLAKIDSGQMSDTLFTELARITPQRVVDILVLRENEQSGAVEVLLIERPKDDIKWPRRLHVPGSVVRNEDHYRDDKTVLNGPLERVIRDELETEFENPPELAMSVDLTGDRGCEHLHVFVAELPPEQQNKDHYYWTPVDDLHALLEEERFIPEQLPYTLALAEEFKARSIVS